jgi:hypothetical protein
MSGKTITTQGQFHGENGCGYSIVSISSIGSAKENGNNTTKPFF